MGSTYENLVALETDTEAVLAALAPLAALVAPAINGAVVVFHDDGGEPPHVVVGPLSNALGGTVLWFGVFDDDALACQVWNGGHLVAEAAVPDPQELYGFDGEQAVALQRTAVDVGVPSPEHGGAEALVVTLVGVLHLSDDTAVREALQSDELFATNRHRRLLTALGLPTFAAGWGRRYLLANAEGYEGPALVSNP